MVHRNDSENLKLLALLKKLRKEAGFRQVVLAERLNRPQSFVSKYETGERTLNFLEVKEVCEALGITLEDFIHKFLGIKE